jgi:hypothetical protein
MLGIHVAITVSETRTETAFDRHIKRLIWCALIGSLALLIPSTDASFSENMNLVGALGAIVVVIAGLTVVRDVGRFAHQQVARRAEAAQRSRRHGACQAAEAIQDRVANLLSATVGYVDFLSEDEHLPSEARSHAQRALESALAASRAVAAFRNSLGCGPSTLQPWDAIAADLAVGGASATSGPWWYDEVARTVRTRDGKSVAALPHGLDGATEVQRGRLIAQSPALRDALADVQHLAAMLLATPRAPEEVAELRVVLERINEVMDRADG